ncbi:MAG: LysR family transcriptional regulator [Thiolinea sp.]
MDIAHLKTFLEIYRIRHFGKAAEKLCITQSAASARIKLLEEQLGTRLFTRSHGSVTPTPAGQRLLKYAEAVVTNWEQAMQNVGLPDSIQQSLRIGCLPDIWHMLLQQQLPALQAALGPCALHLSIHPGKLLTEQVLHGTLEACLSYEPVQTPLMTHQPLSTFELALLTTTAGQTLPQALEQGYIMVDWGTTFQGEYARKVRHTTQPVLHVNSGMMALDILQTGSGSAYLPTTLLQQSAHSGRKRLYAVESAPLFRREIYLIYRQDSAHTALIQTLISTLQNV